MGVSSACAIFECFSTALEWVANSKQGAAAVVYVIDDVLFLAHSRAKCEQDLQAYDNILFSTREDSDPNSCHYFSRHHIQCSWKLACQKIS